jgi:hypothetical protein
MPEYQRVVDEIRAFVQSGDWTFNESLRGLSAEYVEACKEVNGRLRRCEEFLQKGLRSEALHFAQAEPVLLDQAAVLDFPEREQWEQVSVSYALPAPPRLQLDTAEALNRAYAEEQPLEHLLKRHRRLALSRAPMGERLAVLHEIARVDAGNPVWEEDINQFETARLRQIRTEADAAQARADSEALYALYEEVRTTRWLVPPSEQAVRYLAELSAKGERDRQRKALARLLEELTRAHAAYDLVKGRVARDRWNEMTEKVGLSVEDPLQNRAQPALKWLAKEDRRQFDELAFQTSVAELEQALDKGAGEEELDSLYHAVLKHGRGIPASVKARYLKRVESFGARSRSRERIFLVVTFVVGLVLLTALIAFIISRRKPAEESQTGRAAIPAGVAASGVLTEPRTQRSGVSGSVWRPAAYSAALRARLGQTTPSPRDTRSC